MLDGQIKYCALESIGDCCKRDNSGYLVSAVWWWIGKLPLVPSSVLMRVDNCFFAARLLLRS